MEYLNSDLIQEVMDEMFPAKRLKYVDSEEQPKPQTEYECDGKEATTFKLFVPYVSGDKKGERFYDSTFHPDFVHQVYSPDEILRGYKEPRINITLCATNLLCFYSLKHNGIETKNPKRVVMKQIFNDYLPEGSTNKKEDFIQSYQSFPNKIFGEKKMEYQDKNGEDFCITYSKLETKEERDLFERFHKLSLFFVDQASPVQADPYCWSILFTYHIPKDHDLPPYIIGYTSLYTFRNPFHQPQCSLRICQMMVYPSYRKHGHGYKMMDVTYQLCKELQYDCVTVEAPCEDFIMLRDIYDLRRMKDQHILSHSENDNGEEREWIGPRTQQEYQHAASILQCPVRQVQHVYDMLSFLSIDRSSDNEYHQYRLRVKRRLGQYYREELSAITDPDQIKQFFTEIYQDEEELTKKTLEHAFHITF